MSPTDTRPLTIAYVGNFGPRHSTENHVALSLGELGHRIVPLQESDLHAGVEGGWPALAQRCVDVDADLLLWTRTWQHERPEEQDQALLDLRAVGIASASYHLDLYVGLDREEQIGREAFWRTDVVCTADGALSDDEWRDRFGVEHRWVRPGVLAAECVNGMQRAEFVSDVAFVGSHARYHAEWPYRQELLRWLARTYGPRRFKLWPRAGRAIRNEALNNLYASAKVIVGDSLCVGFDRPRYWSDRVYETVGRGGFLIMPRIAGLEDELLDGEHLRYYTFGDFDELRGLIDYYAAPAHDDERRAIAAAGQQRVREACTYTHRVQEVLDHVTAHMPSTRAERTTRLLPVRVNGARPRVQLRPGTTDAEVFRDVFDEQTYKAALSYLDGGVVVDIGANVGAFTLWAVAHGAARVEAYEPEPSNFAQLAENVAGLERVVLAEYAVAAEPGSLYLAPGPDGVHGGGTHVTGATPDLVLADLVRVSVIDIDGVIVEASKQTGVVDVLKIDCEGGEYDIVRGLDGELLDRVRMIVMEFHGPGMPHLPHLNGDDFGPLVRKLAEHGHVTTMGRPSVGGVLTWRRY